MDSEIFHYLYQLVILAMKDIHNLHVFTLLIIIRITSLEQQKKRKEI